MRRFRRRSYLIPLQLNLGVRRTTALMKLQRILLCALLGISAPPLLAQIVPTSRPYPASEILDSLQAGRRRWARAGVVEYQLQSHVDCFCGYRLEDLHRQLPLLTIIKQSIITCEKGKQGTPPSPALTVEDLFAKIEDDARSDGRIIDRLDLHPVYGVPVWYDAHDPDAPDVWLRIQVDSFAVIRQH